MQSLMVISRPPDPFVVVELFLGQGHSEIDRGVCLGGFLFMVQPFLVAQGCVPWPLPDMTIAPLGSSSMAKAMSWCMKSRII